MALLLRYHCRVGGCCDECDQLQSSLTPTLSFFELLMEQQCDDSFKAQTVRSTQSNYLRDRLDEKISVLY